MTKFVATILMFAIAGGFLVAHGQQPTSDLLSNSNRARILEAVLDLELQIQASVPDFANVRNVSDENIDFIQPSSLSKYGFTIVGVRKLRESKQDHIVEYLLFRKIYSLNELAVVELSRVTEGRPCFGAWFSTERTYAYEVRRTPGGWVAKLIRKPAPMIGFALDRSPTRSWL